MSPSIEDALARWVEARRELDGQPWMRLQGRNQRQDAFTDLAIAEKKARDGLFEAVQDEYGTALKEPLQIGHDPSPNEPEYA